MLIIPPIGWKVASGGGGDPGDGYSFTMTAGNYVGFVFGYYPDIGFGSIDAEPIPGETLISCVSAPSQRRSSVAFPGDLTSLLTGLQVWIDGVPFTLTTPWTYVSVNDVTTCQFGNGTEFDDGKSYFIEIK